MEQGYKWVNRESFPNHGVQELGDRVLPKQSPEEEERNVGGLLDRVLERSDTAFVVFNDSSREM